MHALAIICSHRLGTCKERCLFSAARSDLYELVMGMGEPRFGMGQFEDMFLAQQSIIDSHQAYLKRHGIQQMSEAERARMEQLTAKLYQVFVLLMI